MGLDFYTLGKDKKYIGSLESIDQYSKILIGLANKSGVVLDPYGNSRIYLDNCKYLKSELENNNLTSTQLYQIMNEAVDNLYDLICIGD